jgi:hypothetical protein
MKSTYTDSAASEERTTGPSASADGEISNQIPTEKDLLIDYAV